MPCSGRAKSPCFHYWKRVLCRGPNLGHSAKTLFAEGRQLRPSAKKSPRQRCLCRGPGPRQRTPLGKETLCRGPRPSAKTPSTILVYWVTAAEPRQPLPRANRQALGKDFLFYFYKFLCRGLVLWLWPSAKTPFAEGHASPSAENFFWFLSQFVLGTNDIILNTILKIGTNFTFFLYISWIYFNSS